MSKLIVNQLQSYSGSLITFVDSTNVSVGGTLAVSGAATLSSTLGVTGAATLSGGVSGNTTFSGNLTIGSASVGKSINTFSSSYGSNGVHSFYGTDGNLKLQIGGLSNNLSFLYSPSGVAMSFFAGATERMKIHSGGDISFRDSSANEAFYWDASAASLGIGTNSPYGKLSVRTGTNENLNIVSVGAGDLRISAINDAANTTVQLSIQGSPLLFRTSGGAEAMRIDSSGNVGIGATSPARLLSVGGIGKFTRSLTLGANDGTTSFGLYITNEAFANNADTTVASIGTVAASNIPIIFAPNATEVCRVTPNGLTFNGDTSAANALDDYEEGTFTPTFAPTSGAFDSITYTTQYGKYTKIGNRVDINIQISCSAVSLGTAGGVLTIANLPYLVGAKVCPVSLIFVANWPTNRFPIRAGANDGASNILLRYVTALNTNEDYLNGTDIQAGSEITISGTYFI